MSLFDEAKEVKTTASKKGKQKVEKKIAGLKEFAAVTAVIKSLEAVQGALEGTVKAEMRKYFVKEGKRTHVKPESFRGLEGTASASCELRKRSIRSVLSADDKALLDDHKIPYGTNEISPETFIINPEYADDAELLEKVSEALKSVKGLPMDFIQKQAGKSTSIVEEATLRAVFSSKKVDQLFDTVATLAVKPTIAGDAVDALEVVKEMFNKEKNAD